MEHLLNTDHELGHKASFYTFQVNDIFSPSSLTQCTEIRCLKYKK